MYPDFEYVYNNHEFCISGDIVLRASTEYESIQEIWNAGL